MRDPLLERLRDATRGEYEVMRQLGRGRLAAVYLARDVGLDRLVALKVLRPDQRSNATAQRFLHEAGVAANLDAHPNVVRVFRAPERDGLRFLVMQHVDGCSLSRLLQEAPPSHDLACHVLAQITLALLHAHDHGVVHGDVEPGNVLIDRAGNVVVTDFCIASIGGRDRGTTIGTPEYTSPEQWLGAEPSAASDQYALGALAYELLAGAPPFVGAPTELRHAHLESTPTPLLAVVPDCPPTLAALVHHMLAKHPDDRLPGLARVHAMLADLVQESTLSPEAQAAQLGALVTVAANAAAREAAHADAPQEDRESARSAASVPASVAPTPIDATPAEPPIERAHVIATRVPNRRRQRIVAGGAIAVVAALAFAGLVIATRREPPARPTAPATPRVAVAPEEIVDVPSPPNDSAIVADSAAPRAETSVAASVASGVLPVRRRDARRREIVRAAPPRRIEPTRRPRAVVAASAAGDVAPRLDSALAAPVTDRAEVARRAARRTIDSFVADLESRRVDALARHLATSGDAAGVRAFLDWVRTAPRLEISPVVIHAPAAVGENRAATEFVVWLHWRTTARGIAHRHDAQARFRVLMSGDDGTWRPTALELADRFPFAVTTSRVARGH